MGIILSSLSFPTEPQKVSLPSSRSLGQWVSLPTGMGTGVNLSQRVGSGTPRGLEDGEWLAQQMLLEGEGQGFKFYSM